MGSEKVNDFTKKNILLNYIRFGVHLNEGKLQQTLPSDPNNHVSLSQSTAGLSSFYYCPMVRHLVRFWVSRIQIVYEISL